MNKSLKKLTGIVLSLAIMLSMMVVPTVPAKAAEGSIGLANESMTIYHPSGITEYLTMTDGIEDNAKVSVTSSKKEVATVKYDKKVKSVMVTTEKTGKTIVKLTIEQDGMTYKTQCTVTVAKYVNPVSSLKIGKKDYASKLNKDGAFDLGKTVKNEMFQIKAKKGYTLKKINKYYNDTFKPMKIGDKISLKKGESISIDFKDSKGEYHTVYILN